MVEHAYPMHTHETWALLIVDDGAVRYDLERHERGAYRAVVTLLPPHVPHNGRAASGYGFGKRVLYLDPTILAEDLIGTAVDGPSFPDPALRRRIDAVHRLLASPSEEGLELESRLAFIAERLRHHLTRRICFRSSVVPAPGLARHLRDLLDERIQSGLTLARASQLLHASPTYLVRAFSREFGISPHQYLTSRRVDRARRLLLQGMPAGEVAATVGFYDQSHLNRHFRRILGATPSAWSKPSP
jgi:AraC-like DNA-binding protein